MMKRVFTGRITPLLILFFLIIIPQIVMQSRIHPIPNFMFMFFCVMFLLYLGIFLSFAVPFWKYYRSVHQK